MILKNLSITNFKSFDELEVEFRKLNIIVGANASGKSNFVKIFDFLRNVSRHGLDNAFSMEGGVEYLRNMRIGSSKEFRLRIAYDPDFGIIHKAKKDLTIGIKYLENIYDFKIGFNKTGTRFKILRDNLSLNLEFVELKGNGESIEEVRKLGSGNANFAAENKKVKFTTQIPDDLEITSAAIFGRFIGDETIEIPSQTLFLETPYFDIVNRFDSPFEEIQIYDFDPKLPKKAVPITGKSTLEEDGSNMSIVLSNLMRNRENKRRFINLIGDLLPFVNDVRVQKFADKSLLFTLREKYDKEFPYFPASFISDGTINIAALILALYFEDQSLAIIEEPERNIHPYLISRIVSMFEEVSERKQIMVTTHNPEIVKYANIDDLLLVKRNQQGFSTIDRPAEREEVRLFLKNEIGVDELYIQNLLGVPGV